MFFLISVPAPPMGRPPLDRICTQKLRSSVLPGFNTWYNKHAHSLSFNHIRAKSPVWLDCGTEGLHLFEVLLLIALSRIYIWVVKAEFKKYIYIPAPCLIDMFEVFVPNSVNSSNLWGRLWFIAAGLSTALHWQSMPSSASKPPAHYQQSMSTYAHYLDWFLKTVFPTSLRTLSG